MTKRARRNHGAALKPKVALEAVKGEQTLTEFDMPRIGQLADDWVRYAKCSTMPDSKTHGAEATYNRGLRPCSVQ